MVELLERGNIRTITISLRYSYRGDHTTRSGLVDTRIPKEERRLSAQGVIEDPIFRAYGVAHSAKIVHRHMHNALMIRCHGEEDGALLGFERADSIAEVKLKAVYSAQQYGIHQARCIATHESRQATPPAIAAWVNVMPVKSTKRSGGRVFIEGASIQVRNVGDDNRMCAPCIEDEGIGTNDAGSKDDGALVWMSGLVSGVTRRSGLDVGAPMSYLTTAIPSGGILGEERGEGFFHKDAFTRGRDSPELINSQHQRRESWSRRYGRATIPGSSTHPPRSVVSQNIRMRPLSQSG